MDWPWVTNAIPIFAKFNQFFVWPQISTAAGFERMAAGTPRFTCRTVDRLSGATSLGNPVVLWGSWGSWGSWDSGFHSASMTSDESLKDPCQSHNRPALRQSSGWWWTDFRQAPGVQTSYGSVSIDGIDLFVHLNPKKIELIVFIHFFDLRGPNRSGCWSPTSR